MADGFNFDPDIEWLDHLRPTGVVISPTVIKELGLAPERQSAVETEQVRALLNPDLEGSVLLDPWPFFQQVLDWPIARAAGAPGGPALPAELSVALPEYETVLEPTWAVANAGQEPGYQLLVRIEAPGVKPDERGALAGWEATPHQRFERLLRETNVSAGILLTDHELRLVYAPRGETSGWASWPLRSLALIAGRPMLAGLKVTLNAFRLFNDGSDRRLPALLKRSRDAQAAVSTKLAEQVLGALHELLRGLHAAEPEMIGRIARQDPQHLYEGLLAVLMRLVFILYAEDRDLIPSTSDAAMRRLYDQGYAVRTLLGKLQDDAARYPDTMDERKGAWGRLLSLFRLIHGGHTHWIQPRGGKLFDPEEFWFLEGRELKDQAPRIIGISDGCVHRILDRLMVVNGERISYRGLDVEQIGSVYETVMGFTVEVAKGPVLAIKAGKNNKVPVFADLVRLAGMAGDARVKALKDDHSRSSLTAKQQAAIKAASNVDMLAGALDGIVDDRGSPHRRMAPAGTPILQPTDERRRTGSHYTPRSLTEPIVRYALEPAFARIGEDARPEDVLALKVCDPAMGSGAFLVEACRALATRLVQAWGKHPGARPVIPPDEDEELHARRLVAQRCLYGVDKNPMATDLARLSLWLATLAKEHEFTFLDHALKSGDSLVGLTVKQIAAVRWDDDKPRFPLLTQILNSKIREALTARNEIANAPDDVFRAIQEARHRNAERTLDLVRHMADAIVSAFFRGSKKKEREEYRRELETPFAALDAQGLASAAKWSNWFEHQQHPFRPFHWELEFPEVFSRDNGGFDAIVGNPPFAGVTSLGVSHSEGYTEWLRAGFPGTGGKCDLVAFFFRKAFALLRPSGAMGLLATKTIRQGDTRESGLLMIVGDGGTIYRAVTRLPWPGDAAVIVSVVHVTKAAAQACPVLDGRPVPNISSYLSASIPDEKPKALEQSMPYIKGIVPYGEQFFVSLEESQDQSLQGFAAYLRATVGGRELNNMSDPKLPGRFVIDLNRFESIHELRAAGILDAAQARLFAQRDELGDVSGRDELVRYWWRHYFAPDNATKPGRRYAVARAAPHFGWHELSTECVPNEQVVSVRTEVCAPFTILQSRSHELWVRSFSSSLKDDIRYVPTDCFETFPFPKNFETDAALEAAGKAYHDHRAQLMNARDQGMTPTYNRFHDRTDQDDEIVRLRELHADMDAAVLRAYGWDDLADRAQAEWLGEHNEDDHKYQGRYFWPAAFRDEVLARLLALNAERAAAEKEQQA